MTITFAREIDPVAIYAAIVSTIGFVWQIFVWLRTGPRLKVSTSANMVHRTMMIPLSSEVKDTYFALNMRNAGTQQTTITHVAMYAYPHWVACWRDKPSDVSIINHAVPGYNLPYVIEAGHTFMSLVKQSEEVEKLSRERLLFVGVIHSFRNRPVLARVRPIAIKTGNKT